MRLAPLPGDPALVRLRAFERGDKRVDSTGVWCLPWRWNVMAAGPAVEGDVEAKLEGFAVLEGVGMGAARARSKDAHATRCLSRNKTQLGRAPPRVIRRVRDDGPSTRVLLIRLQFPKVQTFRPHYACQCRSSSGLVRSKEIRHY